MCDSRSCFNCVYGDVRCQNARGKFYDKPVLDILICGAWIGGKNEDSDK